MIGKSLRERYALGPLDEKAAKETVRAMLSSHGEPIVQVRARGAQMIACVVVSADAPSIRLCRTLGFEVREGGTAVFGLEGSDASRLFGELPPEQKAWLAVPCAARETKILLIKGGTALVSVQTGTGAVELETVPYR